MHAVYPLLLGALLFAVGLYGVLARRNAITVLMAIELLLNAVTVNLVAFGALLRDRFNTGQVFTLFVITLAAAETGLGLAIVLMIYRQRGNAQIDGQRELAEPLGGPRDELQPGAGAPAVGPDAEVEDEPAAGRALEPTKAAR
ncbi:NADH-quinone oxidoreductase subunit NuoK [Actinocrinis puniceicyclus]|uniref:NADH-quinone oxidoreductase subunit K n=1 Tax=Actinocrinis puniceicyclus TaxID=977794 RepID=A0A8J7WMN1_9ACTN|nr:NADH-quinone oxidoreductase subunit NuoK [Actinocrinis puniceicyclus]MBS2962224.1 NADH-quinone oxidoreductase subunit NuoK [Actinocrinis puniceicyclus]